MDKNFPHVPADQVEALADDMPMGWGVEDVDDPARREKEDWDQLASSGETVYTMQEQAPIAAELWDKWQKFQTEHGRHEPSCDMLLLDKFAFKEDYTYSPQPIGNCVAANSARPWATRSLWQSVFYSGERLGNEEFGPKSVCPSMPAAYGFMRQRGNLRRGDGGFGSAMAEAYVQDGIVACSVPELQAIVGTGKDALPELQDERLYRRFGTWDFNDRLKPHATNKLEECFKVDSLEQLWDALMQGKPVFVCSSFGWTHRGQHQDGFPLGVRHGRWAHNMGIEGCFTTSNGDRVFCWHTLSWARDSEQKWIFYALWDSSLERDFAKMDAYAIGQITGLESQAPLVQP